MEGPVCIAHQLDLPYESKCNRLHGHNYFVQVVIQATKLNEHGMVVDFTRVKEIIKRYDHAFLGGNCPESTLTNPSAAAVDPSTAEVFAGVLFAAIHLMLDRENKAADVHSVSVWETPNNKVTIYGSQASEELERAGQLRLDA